MKITSRTKLADFLPYMNQLILIEDEEGYPSIGTLKAVYGGIGNIKWKFHYVHTTDPVVLYASRIYTISIENQRDLDE